MDINWSVPSPGQGKRSTSSRKVGEPARKMDCSATQGRSYRPRTPTAPEFSRKWNFLGEIPVQDKIWCLEMCDSKFSKTALLEFSHDEGLLDAIVLLP